MSPYVSGKQTYGDRILPDARQDKGGKGCTAYVGGEMCIRDRHNADQAVILAKVRIMAFFIQVLEFKLI